MKRRKLLQSIALATGGLVLPVSCRSWVASGNNQDKNPPRLVVVLLRGAVDGLSIVVPHQEPEYYIQRPNISVARPGEKKGAMDLDGFFGLHPGLKDLMPSWQQKNLAFICNSGSPDETRSHFDAQNYLENGTPGVKKTPDGWLNRLLGQLHQDNPTQALNVGNVTPRIMQGKMSVASLRPGKYTLANIPLDRDVIGTAFDGLYGGDSKLDRVYQEGRKAREIIIKELTQEMMSASGKALSPSQFVDDAAEVAKLIAGNTQTQLAFMDIGGWDTHIQQPGMLDSALPDVGKGLATLVKNLGDAYNNTAIVVLSEFGRTVKENGNNGTDHGHGNFIWLLGGAIKGGKVYGNWTGLETANLYQKRDLPVTTDFRDAIASILKNHLQLNSQQIASVFPDYPLSADKLNLIR